MAKHHVTQVGKHVDKHAAKLAAGIHATLQLWARKLAKRATQGMAKSDMDEVKKILARMKLEGFSVDLVDELTPAMLEAFRLGGAYGVLQTHIDMTGDMTKQLDVEAKAYAEKSALSWSKTLKTQQWTRYAVPSHAVLPRACHLARWLTPFKSLGHSVTHAR